MIDQSNSHQKESKYNKNMESYHSDSYEEPSSPASTTAPSGSYVWRLSSGIVNSTAGALSGAVGLGYGGVKWVAGKGYSAGEVVIDTTKGIVTKVPVPSIPLPVLKRKDKKE